MQQRVFGTQGTWKMSQELGMGLHKSGGGGGFLMELICSCRGVGLWILRDVRIWTGIKKVSWEHRGLGGTLDRNREREEDVFGYCLF